MTWRVIDASGLSGSVSYRRGQLLIQPAEQEPTAIPLAEIQMVLVGTRATISGAALLKLSELGIPLTVVNWRCIPVGTSFGWGKHSRVGARQRSQAEMSLPRRKSAWAAIIREKIHNQSLVLESLGRHTDHQMLAQLCRSVRSGDPDNREGQAARFYWKRLGFDEGFVRDQCATDCYNVALNYGYTILRGTMIRAVVEAGLWPSIGIFHHGRGNAFSLADDLMEPFRPVVDWAVVECGKNFSIEDSVVKSRIAGVLQEQFGEGGQSVDTSVIELARTFGMYAEGELKKLPIPRWQGPIP